MNSHPEPAPVLSVAEGSKGQKWFAFVIFVRGRFLHLPLDSRSQFLQLCQMVSRKRFPIIGRAMAFITTTVNKWTPVFENEQCALLLLDQLQETLKHYHVSLTAYVLMPHHIHLLLGFEKIEEMSLVMQNFKRMSSRRLKPLISSDYAKELDYAGQFRLWQPRFDDVIIWSEKQFKIKIEYIHNNPVRAGLAKTATDYFYSSARDWLSDEKGILPVDKEWTWLKEN